MAQNNAHIPNEKCGIVASLFMLAAYVTARPSGLLMVCVSSQINEE